MARITIARLEIREKAIDKLWVHGIIPEQLNAVLAGRTVITRNRPERAAPYLLVGRDEQGRCLAIPIAPTDDHLT
jgi:hypothetical protein